MEEDDNKTIALMAAQIIGPLLADCMKDQQTRRGDPPEDFNEVLAAMAVTMAKAIVKEVRDKPLDEE